MVDVPAGNGDSLGSALRGLIGGMSRSGGVRSSYRATGWHAQLVQLTGTARGREALGGSVSVTARTLLGWLSEDTTPRRSNRDAIASAYQSMTGSFPQDVKGHRFEISGEVTTGNDTRERGDGRHAPFRVDGSSGDWSRIEAGWNSGDMTDDELEDWFIEDVIYEDPALDDGSGGWGFGGGAYTVTSS